MCMYIMVSFPVALFFEESKANRCIRTFLNVNKVVSDHCVIYPSLPPISPHPEGLQPPCYAGAWPQCLSKWMPPWPVQLLLFIFAFATCVRSSSNETFAFTPSCTFLYISHISCISLHISHLLRHTCMDLCFLLFCTHCISLAG